MDDEEMRALKPVLWLRGDVGSLVTTDSATVWRDDAPEPETRGLDWSTQPPQRGVPRLLLRIKSLRRH